MGKFLFWTFRRWEIRSSFDWKSWCKMIFSLAWNTMSFEYGKVLVLNFSEIGNTVSFWSKKLMESWYFLGIFEFFMIFQDLRNMVFYAVIWAPDINVNPVEFDWNLVDLVFRPNKCIITLPEMYTVTCGCKKKCTGKFQCSKFFFSTKQLHGWQTYNQRSTETKTKKNKT